MSIKSDFSLDEQSKSDTAQSADSSYKPSSTLLPTNSAPPDGLSLTSAEGIDPLDDEGVLQDEDAVESDRQTSRPEGKSAVTRSDAPWVSERHSPADILLPTGVNPFPEPDSVVLQLLGFGVTQELSALIAALHPIVAIPNRRRVEAIANYQYLPIHRLAGHPIEIAVIRNRKLAKQVSTEAVGILLKLLTARSTNERLAVALDLKRPEVWSALFSGTWTMKQQAQLLGVSVKTLKASIEDQEKKRNDALKDMVE